VSVHLPPPGDAYDPNNEAQARRAIELADQDNRKTTQDVEISKQRLILTSPDGTRWNIKVSNAGTISATSL
jgi:hypothetical protein